MRNFSKSGHTAAYIRQSYLFSGAIRVHWGRTTNLLKIGENKVLRLKDEDDASDEAERANGPQDAAGVVEEQVTQHHHLKQFQSKR